MQPPKGIDTSPIERVVEELPQPLVELALWVADYYGSTPGRALALVAPVQRKARGTRPQPAERDSLPARRSRPSSARRSRRRSTASSARSTQARARELPPLRRHGQREDRGLPPGVRGRARTRPRRDRARSRDRTDAADARTLSRALRRAHRRASLRPDARQSVATSARASRAARRRSSSAHAPPSSHRCRGSAIICVDEEHDASYKQESDPRYDARTVAAKRAALEDAVAVFGSATPRPESWGTLERLDLGGRSRGPLPPVRVVDLRREAGYPLSAPLLAELGRDRGARRQGDPAAQPPRRRARAPLPCVRDDSALRQLRRRARPARRPPAPLPSLRAHRARAGDVRRLRLDGDRATRCGNATTRA